MDLLDFFRGVHPWGKLERLLPALPSSSRYAAARASDDERVFAYLDEHGEPRRGGAGPLDEWSPLVERMQRVIEALDVQTASLVRVLGGTSSDPRPGARPSTSLDRWRERQWMRTHDDLVAEVKAAQERHAATRPDE